VNIKLLLVLVFFLPGYAQATSLFIVDRSATMNQRCSDSSSTAFSLARLNLQAHSEAIKISSKTNQHDFMFVDAGNVEVFSNQKMNLSFKRKLKSLTTDNKSMAIANLLKSAMQQIDKQGSKQYDSIAIYTSDSSATMGGMLEVLSKIDGYSDNVALYLFSQDKRAPVSISNGVSNIKVGFYHCPEMDGWKAYLSDLENQVIEIVKQETGLSPQASDRFTVELGMDIYSAFLLQSKILESFRLVAGKDQEFNTVIDLVDFVGKRQRETGVVSKDGEVASDRAIAPPESGSARVQQIFYATNRKNSKERDVYYSGARAYGDDAIKYGICKVAIPKDHKRGVIESPLLGLEIFKDPKKHIYVSELKELKRGDFFKSINQQLAVNSASDGNMNDQTVVFVHGFNVTFNAAVLRTAQLAHDYEFSGIPVLFSWPSDGQLVEYASDREDATWSVHYLEKFLLELLEKSGSKKIHLIAHSMGNQVLLGALHQLKLKGKDDLFESIILAAPDYDSELFRYHIGPDIVSLAQRWTIYTSQNDAALDASSKLNAVQRLGSPVTHVSGIDIIDASTIDVAPWSVPEFHSYYASKQPVIDDMVATLKGIAPAKRKLKPATSKSYRYWQFKD